MTGSEAAEDFEAAAGAEAAWGPEAAVGSELPRLRVLFWGTLGIVCALLHLCFGHKSRLSTFFLAGKLAELGG